MDTALILRILGRFMDITRWRETKISLRFEKVLQPSYFELEQIHNDYLAIFEKANQILAPGRTPLSVLQITFSRKAHPSVYECVEYMKEKRRELESVRVRLREIDENFNLSGLKKEEKEFIQHIIQYFSKASQAALPSVPVASTPMSTVLGLPIRQDSSIFLTRAINRILESIREEWKNVSASFNRLRRAVY